MKQKQLSFANESDDFQSYWKQSGRMVHGGKYSIGKRKTRRPLDSKKPIHTVLKSSKAKGRLSMRSPLNQSKVDNIVHKYAGRFAVRIYDYSNNGDHLHFSVKFATREGFQKFLRTISGLIARLILKAKKGDPKGKFWDSLAFTRVAEWGKSFKKLKTYIFRNDLEASGAIPYDRKNLKVISLNSTA